MADLFTAMAGDEVDEAVGDEAPTNPEEEDYRTQQTSMYLTRLLFLLFGDDAGLWEQDLFYRFVLEQTTAENLGPQLNSLFEVLNTPEHRRPSYLPEHLAKSTAQFSQTRCVRSISIQTCGIHYLMPAAFTGRIFHLQFLVLCSSWLSLKKLDEVTGNITRARRTFLKLLSLYFSMNFALKQTGLSKQNQHLSRSYEHSVTH